MNTTQINLLVGAIPVSNGKILITQRSLREKFLPGIWGLPSGKVNFGEDPGEAVLRELREETGLEASEHKLVGYSTFLSEKDGIKIFNLQLNFLVQLQGSPTVVLDHSSMAYRWIALDEVQSSNLDEFTMKVIGQAAEIRR